MHDFFEKIIIHAIVCWVGFEIELSGIIHILLCPASLGNVTKHSCLETHKKVIGKHCRPRHNMASDQGLHCLLTGFSIKNRMNRTK